MSEGAAAALYPSRLSVLLWACLAAARVSVVCTALVFLLQPYVIAFADTFGLSAMGTFFTLGLGTHTAAVGAYILFFAACERYGWLRQYKIKRDSSDDDDKSAGEQTDSGKKKSRNAPGLFTDALKHMFWYQCVVRIVEVAVLWSLFPYPDVRAPLQPVPSILLHFFVMFFAGEAFNYFFHRAQHEIKWMHKLHKKHHAYIENETISAEYSDFFELLVFTGASYYSGRELPMVLHFVTILWKVAENQEVHSGYSFRGTWLSRLGFLYSYRTEHHEYHHLHPEKSGSYGKPYYFDYWFRTCDDFLIELKRKGKPALYW